MTTVALVALFVVVLAVVALAVIIVWPWMRIVPESERIVIYRLGRFRSIRGPGLTVVFPWEQLERTIDARNQPTEVEARVFAFGVPNTVTLSFWYSFDPARAVGRDREKLSRLVQLSEMERRSQMEIMVRDSLGTQVSALEEDSPLPKDATIPERALALGVGKPRCAKLLTWLKRDLRRALPSLGIILDDSHNIVFSGRRISPEIIEAFSRNRSRTLNKEWLKQNADELRGLGLTNEMLAHMLASSTEGVDAGHLQKVMLSGAAATEVEVGMGQGNETVTTAVKQEAQSARPQPPAQETEPVPEHLTERDLAVLKTVPRAENRRKSA